LVGATGTDKGKPPEVFRRHSQLRCPPFSNAVGISKKGYHMGTGNENSPTLPMVEIEGRDIESMPIEDLKANFCTIMGAVVEAYGDNREEEGTNGQ
jgi:hypothetical protein